MRENQLYQNNELIKIKNYLQSNKNIQSLTLEYSYKTLLLIKIKNILFPHI